MQPFIHLYARLPGKLLYKILPNNINCVFLLCFSASFILFLNHKSCSSCQHKTRQTCGCRQSRWPPGDPGLPAKTRSPRPGFKLKSSQCRFALQAGLYREQSLSRCFYTDIFLHSCSTLHSLQRRWLNARQEAILTHCMHLFSLFPFFFTRALKNSKQQQTCNKSLQKSK